MSQCGVLQIQIKYSLRSGSADSLTPLAILSHSYLMRIFPSEAVGSDCIYSPDLSRYCKWPAGGQRVPIPGILDGLPVYAWKMKENEGFTVGKVLTTIHHHYVQLAKAVMSIVDLCFCPGPAVAVAVAVGAAVVVVVVGCCWLLLVVVGCCLLLLLLLLLLLFFFFLLLLLFLPLQLFSQSRIGRKSSNRSCLRVFGDSRSKKHRKYPCCLRLGSPKPRYLRCVFLLLVAKTTVFTVFFGQHRAKTSVFAQFSACCKKLFFHAKSQSPCKLQCFGSDFKGLWPGGGGPEMNSNRLNNQVTGLASLPFTS